PTNATDTATIFIATHTVEDPDVSLVDECPICLDNYTENKCVRITGIEGCTHRICLACLRQILSRSPGQQKQCPFCRTVWVAATANSARPALQVALPRIIAGALGGLNPLLNLQVQTAVQDATTGNQTPRRYTRWDQGDPAVNAVQEATLRQQTDNLERHRDALRDRTARITAMRETYATEARNFENFNRDLENVRQRARDTPPMGRRSRRGRDHRNRDVARARPDSGCPGSTNGLTVEVDPVSPVLEGPTHRLLTRLRAVARDHAPADETLSQNGSINSLELANQRLRAGAPNSPTADTGVGAEAQPTTGVGMPSMISRNTSSTYPPRLSSRQGPPSQLPLPSPSLCFLGTALGPPLSPHEVAQITAQTIVNSAQAPIQTTIGLPSTRLLNARETDLIAREVALTRREAELTLRDADLTRREDRMRNRERTTGDVAGEMQRQMHTMEQLMERQRDLWELLRRSSE
ncbi:hypothetical protein T440DRAFT_365801, partial [Plenodomus tracheiphilus IPT5]